MHRKILVLAAATFALAACSAAPSSTPPAATPSVSAQAAGYTVLHPGVRWDPCAGPIRYRINFDETPADPSALTEVIAAAVAQVAQATGLEFRYDGTTDAIPQNNARRAGVPTDTDLVFSFASADTSDILASAVDGTVGVGGNIQQITTVDGVKQPVRYIAGYVVMNAPLMTAEALEPTMEPGQLGVTLMHELAHVIGLDHVNADGQMMSATYDPSTPARWGKDDLAGLRALGVDAGCISTTR